MRDTIDMAREAGLNPDALAVQFLERFEALVRADERNRTWTQEHWTEYEQAIVAAEREACAKVCEDMPAGLFSCDMNGRTVDGYVAQWKVAEDIRARGNT